MSEQNDQIMKSEKEAPKKMRIGEKIVALGFVSEDQVQIALQEQKNTGELLGQIMVKLGFITADVLAEVLAEDSGAKKFDAKNAVLDINLIRKLPKEIASHQKVLPIALEHDELQLAMADIYNVIAIDQVRKYFPKNVKIRPLFCSENELLELINQYYDYEMSIDGILKEIETGKYQESENYVNPTVRLVDAILIEAIKRGASDIHFEPEDFFVRIRYRIDGELEQVRAFHKKYWAAIVVRIKIMSGMNIAETRLPQDGRISYTALGREVDFRIASQPIVHGENIVMRLLDKEKSLLTLEQLGFSESNINLLKKVLKKPEGIIVVTGPTGSGKTTTLYSILGYINSMNVNIMTLEDPVEYKLPLIRQSQVKEGSINFGSGIRSMMRQDPDIVFVGEVRDEETAMMSVRAAITGHQVFTTLHTNDAIGAINRMVDIGIPRYMIPGALTATIAQRLVRKLCPHCKELVSANAEECKIMGVESAEIYKPVGCKKCNNKGYQGRLGIVEILRIDDQIQELIAVSATKNKILNSALESGFVTMAQDAINKVLNGDTSLEEVIRRVDMTDRM